MQTFLLLIILISAAPSCSGLEDQGDFNNPVSLERREAVDQETSGVEKPAYKAGEILVKFKNHVTSATVEQMSRDLGLEIMQEVSVPNLYLLKIQGDATVPDVIERLRQYKEVEYSEPNYFRSK